MVKNHDPINQKLDLIKVLSVKERLKKREKQLADGQPSKEFTVEKIFEVVRKTFFEDLR